MAFCAALWAMPPGCSTPDLSDRWRRPGKGPIIDLLQLQEQVSLVEWREAWLVPQEWPVPQQG